MAAPLSPEQMAKLEGLARLATRYEAVLALPDGRRWRVGYCGRRSKAGLLAALRGQGTAILARLPQEAADGTMAWKAGRFQFSGGAWAGWSGRTQRDAIQGGELPFIGAAEE